MPGQAHLDHWLEIDLSTARPRPGLHDLRIACLTTYYNMKAISLHYNITDQLSDKVMVIVICIGMIEKRI